MEKFVQFDFETLRKLIEEYIRVQLGWKDGLSIDFPTSARTVQIWTNNPCSYCWQTPRIFYLLGCLTLGLSCCIMQCASDCYEAKGISSLFRIEYSPYQVFHECVKNQLRTGARSHRASHPTRWGSDPEGDSLPV